MLWISVIVQDWMFDTHVYGKNSHFNSKYNKNVYQNKVYQKFDNNFLQQFKTPAPTQKHQLTLIKKYKKGDVNTENDKK